ncbi:MAG: dihydrolipoyl dehydrogenase [candidate division KSB1 bacterium]|nr:dihydrolipoyl dehydrogenase [candidate division KSB1 bacterium]
MSSEKADLVVIGGGPGGYAAAFYAADQGMDVTLIDPAKNPGGVCLYRGCIPSKALLHVSGLIAEAREAENWGITFSEPDINIDKLRAFKNKVVKRLTGGLGQLVKQRKVNHLQATAAFADNKTLHITDTEGNESTLSFNKAIIATGSRPFILPAFQIDSNRVMDSTSALELENVPEKLLIIGGGYIGLEMGTVYASLGSKVSVVEMLPGILPGADRDLVKVLQKTLDKRFESIMLNTKVTQIEDTGKGIKVSLEGDTNKQETFDKVIVSIGRIPNSENLGLENTGIKLTDRGFIQIDEQRRTHEENIYAIGDIAGEPMLAHKASHEGITAVEAIAGEKTAFEPAAIPAVVFTNPDLAWTGLTEEQAKKQKREIQVARFPWAASGRSLTMDRTDGLTKLIIDPESERVLGMGIVGPGAGELIGEGTLAIEMAANATDLKMTIHPHPTLSETLMETAEMIYGTSTHVYRPKRKK